MKKIITLTLAVIWITACATKVTPNLFIINEHMVIAYSSQGCFHHSSNILVFHENNVTIYKTTNEWNQKIAKLKMGTLTLSSKEKERINNLFTYYETKRTGGCTTREEIKIKRYRDKKLISTKNISDASCGQYGDREVLSLAELIYRLEVANNGKIE